MRWRFLQLGRRGGQRQLALQHGHHCHTAAGTTALPTTVAAGVVADPIGRVVGADTGESLSLSRYTPYCADISTTIPHGKPRAAGMSYSYYCSSNNNNNKTPHCSAASLRSSMTQLVGSAILHGLPARLLGSAMGYILLHQKRLWYAYVCVSSLPICT